MNIVLVDVSADEHFVTQNYHPHPGLAYMAACLEKEGYSVRIVDPVSSNNNARLMVKQICEFKPGIVGFTATTTARFQSIAIINSIKKATNAFIVAGGCHFHPTALDVMAKVSAIDCIVKGEGERTIVEIAQAVESGVGFSKINGIFFRGDGGVIETPDRPINLDLDSLPRPAFHLFNLKRYKLCLPGEKRLRALSAVSSRGCPCKCIFCSITAMQKHNFRKRLPELFLDEVEYLKKTYGYQAFIFNDDTLTMDRNHIVSICNGLLKRNMRINWSCLARVNTVERDLLSLMKSAGCCYIMYGVESGSEAILKIMRKNITIEQATKAIEMTVDVGIPVTALFMVSLPGETKEELRKTIALIDKFSSYSHVRAPYSITCIYPGTELERMAYEQGILPKGFSWNTQYTKPVYTVLGTDPYTPCWENPYLPLRDIKAIIFKSRTFLYKIRHIFLRMQHISLRNIIYAIRIGIRSLTIR
jgi:radical SAM superfamily enzyme YgiQ (UPF0313 family)